MNAFRSALKAGEVSQVVRPAAKKENCRRGSDDVSLTLITCYPFDYLGAAPRRFIVRAERLTADDSS